MSRRGIFHGDTVPRELLEFVQLDAEMSAQTSAITKKKAIGVVHIVTDSFLGWETSKFE